MVREARVTIRVETEALEVVRQMARDEQRTVAQMLRILLGEGLKARGKR